MVAFIECRDNPFTITVDGDQSPRDPQRSARRGAAALGGTGAYGFLYAPPPARDHPREPCRSSRLPPALAGLRIGLITDVHRSRWVSHDDVARAVTMLMAEAPDLIVLGGDYVTWGDREYVGAAAEALGPLSAPFGVFGILGNHDDDHDMPAALAARGVQMLKDARTTVAIKGEAVDLVGIRFWTKRGSGHRLNRPRRHRLPRAARARSAPPRPRRRP